MANTPLTLYGVPVASSSWSSATKAVANNTGAATASYDTALGAATGFSEVFPRGTVAAWQGLGAIPATASGNGFCYDGTLLDGQSFPGGVWNDTWRCRLTLGSGNAVANLYTRVGVRNTGGAVRWIGTLSLLAQTVINQVASVTYVVTGSLPQFGLLPGEKLYYERWANVTTPASGAVVWRMVMSSVTTQGADYCNLATTGYDATPSIAHAVTGVSAALRQTCTRTINTISASVGVSVPGGLTAYANGTYIPVLLNSLKYDRKLADRAGCSFSVADAYGYLLAEDTAVVITDGDTPETLYAGFIDRVEDGKLEGVSTTIMKDVTLKDGRYLADKRVYTGKEFLGWTPGQIMAKLHKIILADEGVVANYALDHDNDDSSFSTGTLTNLVSTGDALQLAPSGTNFVVALDTQADWTATGATFTNTQAVNGTLSLLAGKALKMTGKTQPGLTGDLICCYTIWTGNVACAANDYLEYDVWLDPANPDQNGGIDIVATDGKVHRYTNSPDQMGLNCDPKTDISAYASGQWYHRHIVLDATFNTKHIGQCVIALDGDKAGSYTLYAKNIKYFSSTGTLKATFFDTVLNANTEQKNAGYKQVAVEVIDSVPTTGTYLSKIFTNSVCPVILDASIAWLEGNINAAGTIPPLPTDTSSSNTMPPIFIEVTYDNGATWIGVANHATIATLAPGANISGSQWQIRVTLTATTLNPKLAPQIANINLTVRPSVTAIVTAFTDIDKASANNFSTGTLTNVVSSTDGLSLPCINTIADWDVGDISGLSLYGGGNPALHAWFGGVQITVDPSGYATAFYMTPGTITNFILEVDLQLPQSGGNCGIVYRTTYLGNGDGPNCGAYEVKLSTTQLEFGHGSNASTQFWTSIQTVAGTYTAGTWYHLTVEADGNNHNISVDGVPLITGQVDSSYTGAGYIGVRWSNHNGTVRESGVFDNFGIMKNVTSLPASGNRIHPGLPLSGTAGSSIIFWNATVYSNNTLLVEASLNGGSTWAACVNGGAIPGIVAGNSLAGKTLLIRETLTSSNAAVTPLLTGMHVAIFTQFNATGNRISPALLCDKAVVLGSTAVTWAALDPLGAVHVDAGINGTSWTEIASGDSVPGLTTQQPLMVDSFDSDTHADYTGGFWTGGANPVVVFDTTDRQLQITAGTYATYIWTALPAFADGCIEIDTSQIASGGVVFRFTDVNNCYYVVLHDDIASVSPQTLSVYKRVAGVSTTLVTAIALPKIFINSYNTAFERGTPHTVKIIFSGTVLSGYFDGAQVFSLNDSDLVSGKIGFYQNSAVTSLWSNLRVARYGATAIGAKIYTRVRFVVTDPTYNPLVLDLVASALHPNLAMGNPITITQYKNKYVGECCDDATNQSNLQWRIDEKLQLLSSERNGLQAPYIIATANNNIVQSTRPKVSRSSPLYRNRHYITGAVKEVDTTEKMNGSYTGNATSWVTKYPIFSITSLDVDGQQQSFGIDQVDVGKTFYYVVGQNTFALNNTLTPPLATQTIHITYKGLVPYTAMKENTTQQAIIAALDNSTGIIEVIETCTGLSQIAADNVAQSRIDLYSLSNIDWAFTTLDAGLDPGQILTVVVPEYGFNALQFLITAVTSTVSQKANGTLLYSHDVTCTTGPNVGNWKRNLKTALLKQTLLK